MIELRGKAVADAHKAILQEKVAAVGNSVITMAVLLVGDDHGAHMYATFMEKTAKNFGYGFGFSAYMLFMLYFSQGEHKTSHYALCTGFMALSMMLPGLFAGALADTVGYDIFFVLVMVSCIFPFIVASLLKVDPKFGKKDA